MVEMLAVERKKRWSRIEEEVKNEKSRLQTLKDRDEHIVLVMCSTEAYRQLRNEGYNIYPNHNKGYIGSYLCDLKHRIQHR